MSNEPSWTDAIDLIAHADWSLNPGKRWMVIATRADDGRWSVEAPRKVADVASLPELPRTLRAQAGDGGIFWGLDAPLGVPVKWAAKVDVTDWRALLPKLGQDKWAEFWQVCEDASEISLHRPFYPKRPGGTRQHHILDALGLESGDDIRRLCDYPSAGGTPAPLFWTMGANQMGKAAITVWRDLLQPMLDGPLARHVHLWPMDGELSKFTAEDDPIIVCEAYPGEINGWLELEVASGNKSKRDQAHRREDAEAIAAMLERCDARLTDEAQTQLTDGFGAASDGEDRFDAMVGACGMLMVMAGERPVHEPQEEVLRNVEGWVLGRAIDDPL